MLGGDAGEGGRAAGVDAREVARVVVRIEAALVVAADVQALDGRADVYKRQVIICTGGYGANNEMLADLAPGNSAWCALRDSVTETGDGIRMALWAGAELEAGGACMIWNRAILPDGFEFNEDRMGGDIFLPGSVHLDKALLRCV